MASRLIGLSGYAQSGKDTTAGILIKEYGFNRVSFADALRDSLYALNPLVPRVTWGMVDGNYQPNNVVYERLAPLVDEFGWDELKVKIGEVRELLQRLGTEVGRNILGDNIWVDIAMRKVHEADGPVVITDMRFPNEYDAVAAHLGERWRIERPGYEPVNAHPSETALDNYPFDVRIWNNGTLQDLHDEVGLVLSTR